jgi:hypothetical protein
LRAHKLLGPGRAGPRRWRRPFSPARVSPAGGACLAQPSCLPPKSPERMVATPGWVAAKHGTPPRARSGVRRPSRRRGRTKDAVGAPVPCTRRGSNTTAPIGVRVRRPDRRVLASFSSSSAIQQCRSRRGAGTVRPRS